MNPTFTFPTSRTWSTSSLAALGLCTFLALPLAAQRAGSPTLTLPGHVIRSLANATLLPHTSEMDEEPIQLTVVFNLSDPQGAQSLEDDVSDPNSQNFGKIIGANEYTSRFGPTQKVYDSVRTYLEKNGFKVAMSSLNRRTLTVNGTRAQAQNAFHVAIDDYRQGDRTFHAIARDPALPQSIAPFVMSVFGLSNKARMTPAFAPNPATPMAIATAYDGTLTSSTRTNTGGLPPGLDGSDEGIGLIEFDSFDFDDVEHWLKFAGLPSKMIGNLGEVAVNGGTTPSDCAQSDSGCGKTEVMVDIEGAMGIAQGAAVWVFDAPQGTDLASTVNYAGEYMEQFLNPAFGRTLSTSWGQCEGDIGQSDATGMDSILSTLAASGITLFAASGDSGANCNDPQGSYPNAVTFPADTAHAIAVGGTVLDVNSDNSYHSESWWASGGYGLSQFIPQPPYQSKLYSSTSWRSVPDVAIEAAPSVAVCQATATQSPACGISTSGIPWDIGGTSLAAPLWAGTWAIASQAARDAGTPLGSGANGILYTVQNGFHSPGSMSGPGHDFAHVGLGSPKMAKLIGELVPIQVEGFGPGVGPAAGKTRVTITGTGFIGVKKVKFGGVDATDLKIESDTKLTVDSPQAPSDQAAIEIETEAGKATAPTKFLYTPEIKSISPNSGPMEGGETATVTGYGLDTGEQFVFLGKPATKVSCHSATKCTIVTPANPPGSTSVQAQTAWGGDSAISKDSGYYYDPLSITSMTPLIGPTSGGLMIQINGHSFENGKTTFSFGGANATAVDCSGPDYCYMTSPANVAGTFPVTATVGTITSAPAKDEFTFEVFPTVTGISPPQAKVGAVVALTGTGFSTTTGQTTFNFFGINVPATCNFTTQCTATVPSSTAHSTAVTVTVNGNTSLDFVDFAYPGKPIPPNCKPGTCN
jgi:kumamolisin